MPARWYWATLISKHNSPYDSCVSIITENWLHPGIPDAAVQLAVSHCRDLCLHFYHLVYNSSHFIQLHSWELKVVWTPDPHRDVCWVHCLLSLYIWLCLYILSQYHKNSGTQILSKALQRVIITTHEIISCPLASLCRTLQTCVLKTRAPSVCPQGIQGN